MLIDKDLLRFCAEKTGEIEREYDKSFADPKDGFPRSVDDLDLIMQGIHGKPIYHKRLAVPTSVAKYRSFYIPRADRYDIYYVSDLLPQHLKYFKAKELLQIHLWQESLKTHDVVELVQNMILRESAASIDLDLGSPATSETLAEIAAMEFLFPLRHRVAFAKANPGANGIAELGDSYDIPAFVAQRCMNNMQVLEKFFS